MLGQSGVPKYGSEAYIVINCVREGLCVMWHANNAQDRQPYITQVLTVRVRGIAMTVVEAKFVATLALQ